MQVREQAITVGRRACADSGLQFLDETVALSRARFARNGSGQLQFQRDYRFEFSDTGNNRRPGIVRMLGTRVEWISLRMDQPRWRLAAGPRGPRQPAGRMIGDRAVPPRVARSSSALLLFDFQDGQTDLLA